MSTKEKVQFWLWTILSVCLSVFISFLLFVWMSISYSEKHNTSTAGDHAVTRQDIIISDIISSSISSFLLVAVISLFVFALHQEICGSLNKRGRTIRGLSYSGLLLLGINMLILCLGPVIASTSYYFERVPFFEK